MMHLLFRFFIDRFVVLGVSFFIGYASLSFAQEPSSTGVSQGVGKESPSCTLELKINGAIGPGTLDYLNSGFNEAETRQCRSVLLLINSPGGALATTRIIVEKILNSKIPILCLVSPSGGHAGSAGAIILLACHVSGAEPGTNIGAATPIDGSGAKMNDDLRAKLIQDTVSWVVSLAKLRNRNVEMAEKIVTVAKALDAETAEKQKLIDFVSPDARRFLDKAEGRKVMMAGTQEANVATGALTSFAPPLRAKFLQFIGNPELAYLIFMASIALLYFEITHAGAIAPGIVGGIGLILSLVAFHHLDVWWGGALLIALGLGLLIAESFVPAYGSLGIGGIVAFAVGSLFLYEHTPGSPRALSYTLVLGTSTLLGSVMMGLGILAFRTRQLGPAQVEMTLIGKHGEVANFDSSDLLKNRTGMVSVAGEFWHFKSDVDLQPAQTVEVVAQEGLTLIVKPAAKKI